MKIRMWTIAMLAGFWAVSGLTGMAEPERAAETLTVIDSDGSKVVLTADDLQQLPQAKEEKCICVGQSSGYIGIYDYSGVRLSDVLQKAQTTFSAKEYRQENSYVVFKGTDGYQVIASWDELMAAPDGRRALVALKRDGELLPVLEGRFRLILPGDKYVGRSVKCLETIEVRLADGFVEKHKEKEDNGFAEVEQNNKAANGE